LLVHPTKDLWTPEVRFAQKAANNSLIAQQSETPKVLSVPEKGFAGKTTVQETNASITVPYQANVAEPRSGQSTENLSPESYNNNDIAQVNSNLVYQVSRDFLLIDQEPFELIAFPSYSIGLPGLSIITRPTGRQKHAAVSDESADIASAKSNTERSLSMLTGGSSVENEAISAADLKSADVTIEEKAIADTEAPNLLITDPFEAELSVMNQPAKKSPWSLRFYATPSLSYRVYLDNKGSSTIPAADQLQGPIAPNWVNSVNMFVRHKPMVGIEAGTSISYDVTDKFKVKAGLQANYRQFAMEAYRGQSAVAVILLENNGHVDSLVSVTSFINQNGKAETTLTNKFIEFGIPIGFDVEVASGRIGKLFVSGSFQPTYTAFSKGYLLTTDYSKYVERQDLFTQFNINTAIEAYLQVPGKAVNLQIGPQLRYQATPGTIQGYGVKQHLVDYGLKIGVMKSLR